MTMKKILITGASGFVGSHVARMAREKNFEVVELNHKDTALEDKNAVEKFMEEVRPDTVFHLATSIVRSGKTASPQVVMRTNIEGSINLMDAALEVGVKAFINTGTFVEYGPKDHPIKEDERCDPMEIYAVSKLAATLYVQGLAERKEFPTITLRLFTPYGSNMKEGSLLYNVVTNIQNKKPIALSDKKVTRDLIYVGDVAELYLEAGEKASKYKGEIFNVGSGTPTTLEELVETVAGVTKTTAMPQWGAFPVQNYDKGVWQADMTKTFSHFTWRPKTALKEGLTKTIESMLV